MSPAVDTEKKVNDSDYTEKLNDFIQKNRRIILAGFAAVIVILAIFIVTITVKDRIQAKALTALDDFSRRYDKLKADSQGITAENNSKLDETAGLLEDLLEELNTFAAKSSGFAAARAYSLAASIQWDLKNLPEAEAAWLESARIAAKNYLGPVSLYNAAVAAEEQGNIEAAISHYSRALEYGNAFPSAARAQFSIGRLEESRNKKEAALEAYRKLIGTWPNDPVWSNLAQNRILALQD